MAIDRKARWIKGLSVLAFAAVTAQASGAWAGTAPESSPGTAIAIMQASAALQASDCAAAKAPLNLLWNDPYLDNSDPKLAAQYRGSLIACVASTDGLKAAISLSADNIKRPGAEVSAYDLHVFLLLLDQQVPAAVSALNDSLVKFPDSAGDLSDMSVLGVLLQIRGSDPAQGLVLLDHLEEAHWQPHNPSARPLMGFVRLDGLRVALAAGDAAHTALYRADIARDSLVYAVSQGDGELSDGTAAAMDVRPVMNGEVRQAQAYVAGSPTELTVLSYLMMLERANDQGDLALVQLNGIMDLVDKYGIEKFQNLESFPNLLSVRIALLGEQGRNLDAEKAYADAMTRLTPLGMVDVNLAYMGYLTDRGSEVAALAVESKLDGVELSAEQQAELAAVKACAYAYMGDEPHYAQAMASLNGQVMLQVKPALCAGDVDGAAMSLVAAINDPGSRLDVVAFMQNGLPAIAYSERERAYVDRLAALKARPDVVAAAQAAQITIRSWPLRF